MATRLIPYRGDLVTARHAYKASKKQSLRKFKRELLKVWSLSGRLYLWTKSNGYINDRARKVLGIEKNFLKNTQGIVGFGLELKPSADVNKVLNLEENQKDFLREKCLAIFNKYGQTVKTNYIKEDNSFSFKTFLADGTETSFEGEEDEELAELLYDRLIMYMIDNDSTDTIDLWKDVYLNEADYFGGDIRSKLKSFTYSFSPTEILKMINDRLFKRRTYKTIGTSRFGEESEIIGASGIDMQLFNELLDNGTDDTVNANYWSWDGDSYSLNITAVRNLDENEFMIFIQTHLSTFYDKKKKKWYQKGFFGFIVIVIVVVIAVLTQQYQLLGIVVSLGTALVVAGMVISFAGAILGNEVMVAGGQIVSLVGGGINLAQGIMAEQVALEAVTQQLTAQGLNSVAIQQALTQIADRLLLETMLGVGKFAISTYMTVSNITKDDEFEDLGENITPREKINELYVADDISWDYVQQFMPQFIIASNLKIM
uniref:hypothetical protein n=1 Tax=Aliarcobacter sp. TaxID=2321116 RepID=UPI004047F12D